jgi:hypothetical protein
VKELKKNIYILPVNSIIARRKKSTLLKITPVDKKCPGIRNQGVKKRNMD